MCGRFTYLFTWKQIHDHLQHFIDLIDLPPGDPAAAYPARYNIAPTQPILGIRPTPKGALAGLYRWGLMPLWVKDPRDFPTLFNARIETVTEKPAFRGSIKSLRAIIPASGYFEWLTGADGKKQPYYVTLEDGSPMWFAGLYATWNGPEGEEIDSATIITQAATGDLAALHDRTPAVLRPEQLKDWLDTARIDPKHALSGIEPLERLKVKVTPVDRRVGSIRNDDPSLLEEQGPPFPASARARRDAEG